MASAAIWQFRLVASRAYPTEVTGPFGRFTDRAKRVLALANDEAARFKHTYIGPEHLLLGILREGEGVAARALDMLGVDLSSVRTYVELKVGQGKGDAPGGIEIAATTRQIIDAADQEATRLGDRRVATEHLALGIAMVGQGTAVDALLSLGVSIEQLRAQLMLMKSSEPSVESEVPRAHERLPGIRMESPALLKTGENVQLVALIPKHKIVIAPGGSINYVLRPDDEFVYVMRDELGRMRLGEYGRARYAEIERID